MAAEDVYKLRCTLLGHASDVRAVKATVYPTNGIITGSRDKNTILWTPIEGSNGFNLASKLCGPSKYIASICCLPGDEQNPNGIIAVGSNDCIIYCYNIDSPQPLYTLKGHTDNVCTLSAGRFGTLISGSWDKTAKVWLKEKNMITLEGHEMAVWAVEILPEHGLLLTGSADRSIKVWKAGKCEHTFQGHTDCVRGLTMLNADEFLSCANDTLIKRWSVTSYECLQTYQGHTGFIYSICIIPNTGGLQFVTSSEDRTVRVWNVVAESDQENAQTINLPSQSIWAVTCLQNGDIVAGSSDGSVRIFSRVTELQASPEEQKALDDEVSAILSQEAGNFKESDISPKAALLKPGKRDGQAIMVRDGATITAHQWNAADSVWVKIGDVVTSDGAPKTSGDKTVFEGKEYDYVFSVDVEDGKPPLKLPYNRTEDPWFAAEKFVSKNNLPVVYLEQVANFIVQNSKGINVTQGPSSAVSDPFTGGNRYIPGSSTASNQSGFGDPFTGDSCYKTASSQAETKNKYFPQDSYVKFEVANTSAIMKKLTEFNSKVSDDLRLSDSQISEMQESLNFGRQFSDEQIMYMEKTFAWPQDMIFPSLDILRLIMKNDKNVSSAIANNKAESIITMLLSHFNQSASSANQMLALRTICNIFFKDVSENLLYTLSNDIIGTAVQMCNNAKLNKQVQIAVATIFLNFSILFGRHGNEESKSQLLSAIVSVVNFMSDPEASFRLLVCLGTLLHNDKTAVDTAKSFELLVPVRRFREIIDPVKVSECAGFVEQLLL